MKLDPHRKFLVEYVVSFVNEDIARWEFGMHYSAYVIEHFPGFQAETPRLAAKFAKTVYLACESYAWMDDMAFSYALSEAAGVLLN